MHRDDPFKSLIISINTHEGNANPINRGKSALATSGCLTFPDEQRAVFGKANALHFIDPNYEFNLILL